MPDRDYHGRFAKGHVTYNVKDPAKYHVVLCPCGVSFEFRIKTSQPRKYCSNRCKYKYCVTNGPHTEETKRKIGLANKKFYAEHPERHSKWKGGVTLNPGYKTAMKKKSRLNTIGSHTNAEWESLKAEYGFTCPACYRAEPEIKLTQDHVIPLIKGGSDYIDNIQPLCGPCNTRKMIKIIRYENPMELSNAKA